MPDPQQPQQPKEPGLWDLINFPKRAIEKVNKVFEDANKSMEPPKETNKVNEPPYGKYPHNSPAKPL